MLSKNRVTIILIAGIILLLAIISIANLNKHQAAIAQTSEPVVERVDPYIGEIQAYQAILQRTDLSPQGRLDAEGRLAHIGRKATRRAEVLTAIPNSSVTLPPVPSDVVLGKKLPDGIDDKPAWNFRQLVFSVVNEWRKTTPDHFYAVFAGYLTEDPQQGAVYVFQPRNGSFKLYITPDRKGSVKVVAENGTTITLKSTDGTLFYFDAVNEQFLEAQGTPILTTPFVATPSFMHYYSTPSPPYP